MEQFVELGERIESVWRDLNYNEAVFPDIAADALAGAGIPAKVSTGDVLTWAMKQTVLPVQQDLPGRFGNPPITIYNGPRFHIDVYFWFYGTTSIHQHGFCGAFQVLHGSSIHSWYDFETKDAINSVTEIGEMELKVCELLKVGDIQQIRPGRQYIHALFHLDHPSATIVVRTHKSPLFLPQFEYHKPSLAVDPFFEEANTVKKLQCLTAATEADPALADRLAVEWIAESDFQTAYQILSSMRGLLKTTALQRQFGLDPGKHRFEALFEAAERRHGDRATALREVLEHRSMVDEIVNRRAVLSDPEQRFFLALLMNVEGAERILGLVRSRFPDDDPVDKVLDWTFDLGQTKLLGINLPNALGIQEFTDFDSIVLEYRLRGRSDEELLGYLGTQQAAAGEELRQMVESRREALRGCVILQPLFK